MKLVLMILVHLSYKLKQGIMNIAKLLSRSTLFLLGAATVVLATRCSNEVYAQNGESEAVVTRILNDQRYVFKAQQVMPSGGRTRNLTGDNYDLTVTKDSVSSWLPYFGRAYSAPIDPTKGGFQFVSTEFDYNVTQNNDSWDITIKPKDTRDVQELYLTVFKNGNSTLRVSSISRQPISFSGVVTEKLR